MAILGRSQVWVRQPQAFGVQPGVLQRPFVRLARTTPTPGRVWFVHELGAVPGVYGKPVVKLASIKPTPGRVRQPKALGGPPSPPNAHPFLRLTRIPAQRGAVYRAQRLGTVPGVAGKPVTVRAVTRFTAGAVRRASHLGTLSRIPIGPLLRLARAVPTAGAVRRSQPFGAVPGTAWGPFTVRRVADLYRSPPPGRTYLVPALGNPAGVSHAAYMVLAARSYRAPFPGHVAIYPHGGSSIVTPEMVGHVHSFGRFRVFRVAGEDTIR